MGALRAFKQDVAALALHFLEAGLHIREVGDKTRGQGQQAFGHGVGIERLKFVKLAQQDVFFLQGVGHLGAHQVGRGKVARAQAHAGGFVFITGAEAPARGADFVAGAADFAGLIQAFVVGQDEVGFFADAEARGAHVHAAGGKVVHFFKENMGVQHNAVADEADFVRVQNAGRDEVEDGFLPPHFDGVASVVAALEAHDGATLGAQHVHNFALALVAPLGADDDRIRHGSPCLKGRAKRAADGKKPRPRPGWRDGPKTGRKAFEDTYPGCVGKSNACAAQRFAQGVGARRRRCGGAFSAGYSGGVRGSGSGGSGSESASSSWSSSWREGRKVSTRQWLGVGRGAPEGQNRQQGGCAGQGRFRGLALAGPIVVEKLIFPALGLDEREDQRGFFPALGGFKAAGQGGVFAPERHE